MLFLQERQSVVLLVKHTISQVIRLEYDELSERISYGRMPRLISYPTKLETME
jgi:hypothetical protein